MKIRKSLKSTRTPKACFQIQVEYTHGDADLKTQEIYLLKTTSDADLISYIEFFKKVSSDIDACRAHNTNMPAYLSANNSDDDDDDYNMLSIPVPGTTLIIQPQQDCYVHDYSMTYYANMDIDFNEIYYYDEYGVAYDVFVEER